MIDYNEILKPDRLRTSTRAGRTILTESESDRGRVLFCPAFRRLQQKAQVFSMEPNAAVRSRLTHSFEVSQIGRFLVDEICQRLVEKDAKRLSIAQLGSMVNFVETACLMHDIGNPPFGHFGEAAIQEWFKKNGTQCLSAATGNGEGADLPTTLSDDLVDRALADFRDFDGNPQGLRIVARLQWNSDEFGLNLTKTTLASFLKYVRSPLEKPSEDGFKKKAGYFSTEAELVQEVWKEFGYIDPQRFPLAYIMEAADDIAYCISDLEDSFEKKVVYEELAFKAIEEAYQQKAFSADAPCHSEISKALAAIREKKLGDKEFTFIDFRTNINNAIVRYGAEQYVTNEELISSGDLKTLLPENEPPGHLLKVLKDFCRKNVYTHVSVQRTELAGYNAISGLLEEFKPLLTASRKRFENCLEGKREDNEGRRILLEPKLLTLFPKNYIKVYKHHLKKVDADSRPDIAEWMVRAHLVVDFISGMTDDFAMTTFRTLAGIEL
jgi:dGTPase